MAKKREAKKCRVSSAIADCDVCGEWFTRLVHERSQCVPDHLPMPKSSEHVTDNPPRWICEKCVEKQNFG